MRALVVVFPILVAGCNAGDWFGSPFGECPASQFGEAEVASTPAGKVFAATRDGCGFPDAETEYRLYFKGRRFAEGSMQTNHWAYAITRTGATYVFRLYDQRCVLDELTLSCRRCGDDASCYPAP